MRKSRPTIIPIFKRFFYNTGKNAMIIFFADKVLLCELARLHILFLHISRTTLYAQWK